MGEGKKSDRPMQALSGAIHIIRSTFGLRTLAQTLFNFFHDYGQSTLFCGLFFFLRLALLQREKLKNFNERGGIGRVSVHD